MVVAFWLGSRFSDRIDAVVFGRLLYSTLIMLGLVLLV
jgi:hypothetical protein